MSKSQKTKLRVGTDCSGIEAPIQALKQLKIPFEHVFSSEIDKYCIQSIKANYNPGIIFGDKEGPYPEGDITKRNISDVPDIDLYVCGFPCQTFSQAGSRKGFEDHRGKVFWGCLEVIETKQPKYFILENVKGLLSHDKGETWKVIWDELQKLERYGYTVQWKVMNTKDYGIPQNRERVYMVGTKGAFEWPIKTNMDDLNNYVDWEDNSRSVYTNTYKNRLKLITNNTIFVSAGFNYNNYPNGEKYAPCLIRSGVSSYWCKIKKRVANIKEWLMLQGFSTDFLVKTSTTQIKKQLANSMSVNVVKGIIKSLLT